MSLIVLLTAYVPEVGRHGSFAIRRVFLRVEGLEILRHVAQVFATRLHCSRHRAEAVTRIDGLFGLGDVVLDRLSHIYPITHIVGGRSNAMGA